MPPAAVPCRLLRRRTGTNSIEPMIDRTGLIVCVKHIIDGYKHTGMPYRTASCSLRAQARRGRWWSRVAAAAAAEVEPEAAVAAPCAHGGSSRTGRTCMPATHLLSHECQHVVFVRQKLDGRAAVEGGRSIILGSVAQPQPEFPKARHLACREGWFRELGGGAERQPAALRCRVPAALRASSVCRVELAWRRSGLGPLFQAHAPHLAQHAAALEGCVDGDRDDSVPEGQGRVWAGGTWVRARAMHTAQIAGQKQPATPLLHMQRGTPVHARRSAACREHGTLCLAPPGQALDERHVAVCKQDDREGLHLELALPGHHSTRLVCSAGADGGPGWHLQQLARSLPAHDGPRLVCAADAARAQLTRAGGPELALLQQDVQRVLVVSPSVLIVGQHRSPGVEEVAGSGGVAGCPQPSVEGAQAGVRQRGLGVCEGCGVTVMQTR